MQDEFINRLGAFKRSLGVLDKPEHKKLWEDKPPVIFTVKTGESRIMTGALGDAQKQQETGIGGPTEEKDREETELEDTASVLGQAMGLYHKDHGQETEAGEVDLTLTEWRKLRDQQLLAKSQLLIDRAAALASGDTAEEAAKYGITPAAVAALTKERKDYDEIVNAPDVAIAIRKALTRGLRPAFNATEAKFAELDRLILQFRTTPEGRAFVEAWKAARIVKDSGGGGGKEAGAPADGTPSATPQA